MPDSRLLRSAVSRLPSTWLRLTVLNVALLATAVVVGRVWSQQPEPEQAIRDVLTAQQAAWNRGDIPAFLEGYWKSPDLTFAGSEGFVRGHEGLLARYKKSYPTPEAMGQLDFSGLEIRPLGPDAALVLGHWHLKREQGDIGGVFTLIFRRFPTGWRIIHDHTSAQKQTP